MEIDYALLLLKPSSFTGGPCMCNIIFEVSPRRGCYNRDQLYFYLSFTALLPEHHLLQTFCIHLWKGTSLLKFLCTLSPVVQQQQLAKTVKK